MRETRNPDSVETICKKVLFLKTGYGISCKLSPMKTICIYCQILFSEINKIHFNLSSAKFVQTVVKVKTLLEFFYHNMILLKHSLEDVQK